MDQGSASNMNSDNVNSAEKVSSSSSNDGDGLNNELSSMSISIDTSISNELSSMTIDGSSSKKKKNICLFCLKEVQGLQGCSQCGTARYCGKACQVKHWPVHKNTCLDSNDAEDSNQKLDMKANNHFKQGNCIHIYQRLSSLLIY